MIAARRNHFRHQVCWAQVRSIKVGKTCIVPVIELERWLYLNAQFADEEHAEDESP
jgi:hypothetical protein